MIFLRVTPRRTGLRGLLEISTAPAPSVTFAALVNLLVTADAQALQIALIMSAAVSQRFDMMHQLGLAESSLTLTPFTKRMAADVAVPYLSPNPIVSLVVVVATGEVLVVPLHHLAVVFAVTAFVVCQLWAATIPTGSLWFSWHSGSPRFLALKNLLGDCSRWRFSSFYFMLPF